MYQLYQKYSNMLTNGLFVILAWGLILIANIHNNLVCLDTYLSSLFSLTFLAFVSLSLGLSVTYAPKMGFDIYNQLSG